MKSFARSAQNQFSAELKFWPSIGSEPENVPKMDRACLSLQFQPFGTSLGNFYRLYHLVRSE